MENWENHENLEKDIVVTTRMRVARNLDGYNFPHTMSPEESKEVTEKIIESMDDIKDKYKYFRTKDINDKEKVSFVEQHLISPQLIQSKDSSFFIRKDKSKTIMINEEDHLRIQVLSPGFNLKETWEKCTKLDDLIEKKLDYAFSEDYGYLTTCPTNVGTGLRASVMVHLPGLYKTGHIRGIREMFRNIGLTMRGIYGEGTNALGELYQISNQTTLGQSEEKTINRLYKILIQVLNRERETQKLLLEQNKLYLEDEIYRSLGILKYSRKIKMEEAMNHLSNINLGVNVGILPEIKNEEIINLMVEIQPASLQLLLGGSLTLEMQLKERASLLRKKLEEWEE